YIWTGSTNIDTRPAMHMMIATTAAKIGRSMKNRENMAALIGLLTDADLHSPSLRIAGATRHLQRWLQPDAIGGNAFGDERVADGGGATLREVDVRRMIAAAIGIAGHVDRI